MSARLCTECQGALPGRRQKVCSDACQWKRTVRLKATGEVQAPSAPVQALLQEAKPGLCLICEGPLPQGHKRLCASAECIRTYQTLHRMYARKAAKEAR